MASFQADAGAYGSTQGLCWLGEDILPGVAEWSQGQPPLFLPLCVFFLASTHPQACWPQPCDVLWAMGQT